MVREQIAGVWFEWDEKKSDDCLQDRGLTFGVAVQAFFDEHALTSSNMEWEGEERFQILGGISPADLLIVVFVIREHYGEESYRIISARRAIATEEAGYWRGF